MGFNVFFFFFSFRHQAVTEDVHADLLKPRMHCGFGWNTSASQESAVFILNQHWERLGELMSSSDREENTVELLNSRMQASV